MADYEVKQLPKSQRQNIGISLLILPITPVFSIKNSLDLRLIVEFRMSNSPLLAQIVGEVVLVLAIVVPVLIMYGGYARSFGLYEA